MADDTNQPITDAEVQEWQRLCAAATLGPWEADQRNWCNEIDEHGHWYVHGDRHEAEDDDEEEVDFVPHDVCTSVCRVEGNATSAPITEHCARLIAAARTVLPRLLAERERLLQTIEDLQTEIRNAGESYYDR